MDRFEHRQISSEIADGPQPLGYAPELSMAKLGSGSMMQGCIMGGF